MAIQPIFVTGEDRRHIVDPKSARETIVIASPDTVARKRSMVVKPGSIAAALLIGGAMAGLSGLGGTSTRPVVRKHVSQGKRSRDPGIRKQRDKAKAARKARVKNKGR